MYKRKFTIALVTAMVMTIAMVVVAYAEYVYAPAWNEGTGRYTQVYEMSIGTNWRYTASVSNYSVQKKFPERDCLVQCTYNGLTTFPTYYQVYIAYETFPVTEEINFTGTGTHTLDFPYAINASNEMSLGIRHDPRDNSNRINRGNWSPDTY